MSSIPLPALAIQPPQQPDTLGSVSKLMALKSMMANQQAQQQEMQLRQQQIQDQQATTAAMKDWDGKDYDSLASSVLKNGGSANAAQAVQQHGLGIKKAVSDIAAQDAATGSKKLDTFIGAHKAVGDSLEPLVDPKITPDDQLHDKATATVQQLAQAGIMDPQSAQQALQGIQSVPDPATLRQHIDALAKASMGAKAVAEQAKTTAETKKDTAQGNEADAATQKTQLETQLMQQYGTPAQQEAKYVALQTQKNQNVPLSPPDAAFVKSYEKLKTLNTQFKFNLDAGGASGQPLTPAQQAVATAIQEGRQTAPTGRALSSPYWQTVMGGVYQQDPQWNEQRAELRKSFTVGKQSTEINAINTAMGHVGVMGDAIDALNNGDVRILNSIANRLGLETGSTPQAVFKTIVHRVGPEISKAYVGAGGSAGERGSDEKDFDENLAPQTIKANVGITAQLLRSKIGALENQWDQNKSDAMPAFQDRFITPEAKAQLDKWAPQKAAGAGNAGSGHVIKIGDKQYQYKGSGNTADLSNYTEIPTAK